MQVIINQSEPTRYFVTDGGVYLGGFSGSKPEGGIEVPSAPNSASDIWNGSSWVNTPPVPTSISTAQGHLALIEYGKYQAAVDFIKAIPDPTQKLIAEVNFYRRNDWQRDNETLLVIASALGISDAELDQMFILGSTK